MPKLDIPYRSQWDNDANLNSADCGPTCVAMILNHAGFDITPNGIYDFLAAREPGDFTHVWELVNVLASHQLAAQSQQYADRDDALQQLRSHIDAGRPMIALVKYRPWREATGHTYEWGHFVVITGYDDRRVFMHDPLFGLTVKPRDRGRHFPLTHDQFAAGWGGFPSGENPNWVSVVVGKIEAPAPRPEPIPTPPTPTPAPATPTPAPPPAPPARIMEDEARRIRTLAAYRWAAAPDFGDDTAVQLWRDHLGDFGLTYDEYVVQGGDTLAGLAARFYGEQHRWHAIKAYNNLQREGLWLGETLLIPNLGQSGAHKNPALPADTADFAKAIALDDIVNPDLPAQDYNALGMNSIGIGFVTQSE